MARSTRRWERGRLASGIYDAGVERVWAGRFFARLLWRADARPFYAQADVLAGLDGSAVLDVPCGGGVLVRGLPAAPARGPFYVGCDISPVMLRRARRRFGRVPLRPLLVRGDVHALPFADARFDLCLTQNGVHCFPRPERAVGELARVLKPGGEVRGTVVAAGTDRWTDLLIGLALRTGLFAVRVYEQDLRRWLSAAGLERVTVERSGALVLFSARRPPG
jgi:ubiquinone/menaquinone biosynthesis C-methylase UbiE